jgi:hypothetical protein
MIGIRDGKSWLVRIVVYRGISRREPGGVARLLHTRNYKDTCFTFRSFIQRSFGVLLVKASIFHLKQSLFAGLSCKPTDHQIEIPANLSL